MIREEYLQRLVDDCYVDLYLAGCDGARIEWPWRMARRDSGQGSLGDRYRDSCDTYWVDSAIGNPDYGNRDVLDDAERYGADAALLADTEGDFDETVESLHEGLEIADDHAFNGDVIIPLQAPFDECYREFEGESTYYAIGGYRNEPDYQRIEAARTVRDVAGWDIHLHGLGWGPRDGLAKSVHANPDLIDSVDYSTPVQSNTAAMPGDERMSVVAAEAGAKLVRDLRRLTPHVEFESTNSTQGDLESWGLV